MRTHNGPGSKPPGRDAAALTAPLGTGAKGAAWASANVRAGLWIIASCFFFSTMNALAKLLVVAGGLGGLHPLQVTFARYLFAALALAPFALHSGLRLPTGALLGRYAVRVGAGYLGVVLMFAALRHLRLSDATAIGFTSPFFAIISAVPLLGERADRPRWLAAIVGFIGVVAITRPTDGTFQPAALVAVLAAMAMGVEIVGVKWVSMAGTAAAVLFISNALAVPLGAVTALPVWQWPSGMQWIALAAIGAIAAVGQVCVLRGARLGDAAFIAPFFYFSLVFATVLGAVLFSEMPPPSTIAGAAIIIGSALYAGRAARRTAGQR